MLGRLTDASARESARERVGNPFTGYLTVPTPATDNFSALFTAGNTGVQIGAQYDTASKMLSLTATGSMKTDFYGLLGFFQSHYRDACGSAKARRRRTACVLVLNPAANGAATLQGVTMSNLYLVEPVC